MAGELGFEPRLTESESAVLPLNYSPIALPISRLFEPADVLPKPQGAAKPWSATAVGMLPSRAIWPNFQDQQPSRAGRDWNCKPGVD